MFAKKAGPGKLGAYPVAADVQEYIYEFNTPLLSPPVRLDHACLAGVTRTHGPRKWVEVMRMIDLTY
jgi:hypothetical protein